MMLVTLQQASDHLRRDTDADDTDLTDKIMAASQMVMNYIEDAGEWGDSAGEPFVDSSGLALNVPPAIQAATLMTIGWLYRERDGSLEYVTPIAGFYLPIGVTAILYPYRTPTAL